MTTSLPSGFVYIDEIIPDIRFDIRYSGTHNLFGREIKFYHANRPISSIEAALALQNAQENFQKHGFCLVIYDAYRPQPACQDMVEWAKEGKYPAEGFSTEAQTRQDLFAKGYVSDQSSHCRGSTIDATIIRCQNELMAPVLTYRKIGDKELPWLDDGTCDMGTHFDFMGKESHTNYPNLSSQQKEMRIFFVGIMKSHGLLNYAAAWEDEPQEWWHFTLGNEPYPNTYFSFPVE
jgi:D-alanyl-D-alanine dipeptidase